MNGNAAGQASTVGDAAARELRAPVFFDDNCPSSPHSDPHSGPHIA